MQHYASIDKLQLDTRMYTLNLCFENLNNKNRTKNLTGFLLAVVNALHFWV